MSSLTARAAGAKSGDGRIACSPRAALWQTPAAMSDVIDTEGFRANVGIVLMRGAGEVFLGRRTGGRGWQFPQGGVRRGEQLEEALYRELHEEVGL